MRARKSPHFQRLGDRSEDLLDLFGENGAKASLIEMFEFLLRDRLADSAGGFGAEVGRNQRLLDVVERRGVERGAAGEAGEVVGNPVGGLLKPAAQAVEPTHAQTAIRWSPLRPVTCATPLSPRAAPSTATAAKLFAWPLP